MRCATLAEELRRRGATVSFLCRTMEGNYIEWLSERGIEVARLPGIPAGDGGGTRADDYADWLGVPLQQEIAETDACLAAIGSVDWLVVDHYALDAEWEKAMRGRVGKILCIDDLANRGHDCDLLLDQNYCAEPASRYAGLVPEGAMTLVGPRYALLRPEFALWRSKLQARDGKVRRVLIFMGGSDIGNATMIALQALGQMRAGTPTWRVDVVLGAGNPHFADIQAMCEGAAGISLHRNLGPNEMAALMASADLAIGAGGSTNWERACLGLPSLVFALADNQKLPLRRLVEDGYVAGEERTPDIERLTCWLELLAANPAWLRGLGNRSASLVDGDGVRRVADRMLSSRITFRQAVTADSDDVWRWRNAPAVRHKSISQKEIDLASHRRWFEKTLEDPHRVLLIAEWSRKAIGVVRFDVDGNLATISVFRVPDVAAPGGLVREASQWLMKNRPDLTGIIAEVLTGNEVSLASFLEAGYRQVKDTLLLELDSNKHGQAKSR
jgi:UDP-2,4-diacetamido-2,4,6-trideoxy-beta-L-altropyranose hydrolase